MPRATRLLTQAARGWSPRLLALGLLLLTATGCDEQPSRAAANSTVPAPIAVTVLTLERREIPVTSVLPGRTAPFRVAEVRPQVGGVLRERLFTEGEAVTAGS